MAKHFLIYSSPIGQLYLSETDGYLSGIDFDAPSPDHIADESEVLLETKKQLEEYFEGKRKIFNLPLALRGTPFQLKVWNALTEIPYGKTCSYADIALAIGNPKAVRAVGMANNRNPLMIVIPCHRVIGKDGSLVGYAGGVNVKSQLLSMEAGYRELPLY